MVIRSWRSLPLKHSKSSSTITTGGQPQWRSNIKPSSNPNTEEDSSGLFNEADVFLPKFFSGVVSVSCGEFSTELRDFWGIPRFVGDCICPALSSELRKPVLVAIGDAGNFWHDGFLTGDFDGEAGNDTDPKFPSWNSWRCNTTTGCFLTGDLAGETVNRDDAKFSSAELDFDFPHKCSSESGSFSGEEFTPVGEWIAFVVVTGCCNFWGVAPLRRPVLEPVGDARYFRGDLFAGGVIFWRFDGVPAGVFCDVRFCGEDGAFVPALFSPWHFLLVLAGDIGNRDGAIFSLAELNFNFPHKCSSEPGSFSGDEFTPVGEWIAFVDVTSCCNFWGVAPLRRPALQPAGDAGYFLGDLFAGGVISRRFTGVPAGVFCDVRFCGEDGAFIPALFSLWHFLLVPASQDDSVCTICKQHHNNILFFFNQPTQVFYPNLRAQRAQFEKLQSPTWQETSSTVCLHLCSDSSSICYSTVTLNFDLLTQKFKAFISVP